MAKTLRANARTARALGVDLPAPDDEAPEWDRPEPASDDQADDQTGDQADDQTDDQAEQEQPTSAAWQNFIEWMSVRAVETDEDNYTNLAELIEEMSGAEDPAEVLAGGYPLHAAEVLGRPLIITRVRIRAGEYEESGNLGFYAAMFVRLADTGQERVVTCGAVKVMAKLYNLDAKDMWPVQAKLVQRERPGKPPVMNLVPWE